MSNYQVDYDLDETLTVDHVNRLVRFSGNSLVGLCTAPGAEVGVLLNFYGNGRGCVLQSGGPAFVTAGAALNAGDRITSDGQGRAMPGGAFAIVQAGAAQGALATVLLSVLPSAPTISVEGPKTSDGKLIFLPNMFPGGTQLYLAGAGDDPIAGRGDGPEFNMASEVAGTTILNFGFNDATYFACGTMMWKGAEVGDSITLEALAPASPITSTPGVGNANVVNGVLVPANGDGAVTVDLAAGKPVPIPAFNEEGVNSGMWNYSEDDTGPGTVTAATSGQGNCHLVPAEVKLSRFANKMQLLGDGSMNLTLPAIKPKLMWPAWVFKTTLKNSGHAGLRFAWMLTLARYATL